MKLTKIALDNYRFTIIMFAMLVLVGLVSFLTMPRSEDPQVSPAGSNVVVVYPGASPEDLEELVVKPLEEAINELEDIKKFNTSIEDGMTVLQIEFESGVDPDDKYTDVLQKVNRTRNQLPDGIVMLDVIKWSISNVNIVQLALVSDKTAYSELEKRGEMLKKRIEQVPGIKTVKTWAFPEQVVDVAVDVEKAAMMHIPLQQIIGAIQSNSANIPGGSIDIGDKKFNIRTSGFYESIDAIANTVIHGREGTPVLLKDVATVAMRYEDKTYYARFKGEKAIFVSARQKLGTNIFTIMDEVHDVVDNFATDLPAQIRLEYAFDQSESVSYRINVFFSNLLQGMLLVGLVIFLIFGFRESVVIALAIPISIAIAIGFVDASGYGLEQMSIAALVIALGLLVDNAIVIVENISRFIKDGMSRYEAAIKATEQVAWAIVSSTVTTVLAFIPIIMMQNVTGDFIRSMPVTVVFTLTASLFVALTLSPYLASKILKPGEQVKPGAVQRFTESLIANEYRKRLVWALKHPWWVIVITSSIFFGSMSLFPLVGVSFFPDAEKPQFLINIETPQGSNLDFTNRVAKDVEKRLAEHPDVKLYTANIGRSNPQVYYNVWERNETSNFAQLLVELKENDLELFARVTGELREELSTYPGAKIEVQVFKQGPPVNAPIEIKVVGDNLDILKMLANETESIFRNETGVINIANPLRTSATDIKIAINHEKAAMLGIPVSDIDLTVRIAIAGFAAAEYHDPDGESHDILVRLPVANKPGITDLDKIYLTAANGMHVPLKQVARVTFAESPSNIKHTKLQRNATVTADVLPGTSVDQATRNIVARMELMDWPEGYYYQIAGEQESRQESFGGMGQAIIIAGLAIFGVLVLQFNSFRQPFIVFAAFPLAIIGSILALLITGWTFSFTAFIGITSLVGIVINNSIILVDFTNQLRRRGMSMLTAIQEASETRFLPIVLTTATTIGGLIPLTLGGGSLWAPMGWTIIGGLLVSTFLTLLVVPVLYSLLSEKQIEGQLN
jgi:multidrug efflux pump subunit AcrB